MNGLQIDEDVEVAEIAVHPPPPLHVHFHLPDAPVDRHLHLGQRRAANHPVLGQAVPFLEVLDRRHRLVVIAIARSAVGGVEIAGHHQIAADHRQPIVVAARLQRRPGGDRRPAAIGLDPAQFPKLGAHPAIAVGYRFERLYIGSNVLCLLGAVEQRGRPDLERRGGVLAVDLGRRHPSLLQVAGIVDESPGDQHVELGQPPRIGLVDQIVDLAHPVPGRIEALLLGPLHDREKLARLALGAGIAGPNRLEVAIEIEGVNLHQPLVVALRADIALAILDDGFDLMRHFLVADRLRTAAARQEKAEQHQCDGGEPHRCGHHLRWPSRRLPSSSQDSGLAR